MEILEDFYYTAIRPVAPAAMTILVIALAFYTLRENITEFFKGVGAEVRDVLQARPTSRSVNAFGLFLLFVIVIVLNISDVDILGTQGSMAMTAEDALVQHGAIAVYIVMFIAALLLCVKQVRTGK